MTAKADALMGIFGFNRVEGEAMDKVRDARRALFEARYSVPKGCDFNGAHYMGGENTTGLTVCNIQWDAFNAALDAVEIELPQLTASWYESEKQLKAATQAVEFCRTAINYNGLGLRIK